MFAILVLSLMEWDKQPLKLIFSIFVGLVFFVSAAIYLPLQPISLDEHLPGVSIVLSQWIEQILKLTVGGIIGALMGWLSGRAFSASHPSILIFAFSLTGVVLGWQALVQVAVLFGVLSVVARVLPKATRLRDNPTAILLVAIAIHHPFWSVIAGWWRFS